MGVPAACAADGAARDMVSCRRRRRRQRGERSKSTRPIVRKDRAADVRTAERRERRRGGGEGGGGRAGRR
eukprot:360056-Chlamydomonas_euryale.AAC.4